MSLRNPTSVALRNILSFGGYLLFACLFFLSQKVGATHIVGGDVTYRFVSFNADSTEVTYDIVFNMYRDTQSGGAPFDNPASFGVYRQRADGGWDFIPNPDGFNGEYDVRHGSIEQIPFIDDPCRREPDNVGVESTIYTFRITLEVSEFSYMIAYQRCCRNPTVVNIAESGSTGVAFNVVITPAAQRLGNSSPTFSELPPIFICAGFNIDEDVSGTDIDGDFLRYSFCTPSAAGGDGGGGCENSTRPRPSVCLPPFDNVRFIGDFSTDNPMGCLLYTSPSPRDGLLSRMPSSA